ncbi:M13 family metallopeptidase [Parasphingorhabdus sp. DH2-15]|uniref:M13 family metallopeptidase n=1 Tax=Parasphingorhabdus sp. DH2-15 TaxID=3444112 RepID=UPI003F6828E4
MHKIFNNKLASKGLLGAASIIALISAGTAHANPSKVSDENATEEGVKTTAEDYWGEWGINTNYIKDSVHPGDDFFAYVNGKWLDEFEIPDDRSRYGGFTLLAEKSEQRVRAIIEELAAKQPEPGSLEGKIAAYFNAYMDVDAINAAGLTPLQPQLTQIFSIKDRADLAKAFGTVGISSPFGGFVGVDSKNTEQYTFYVGVGGLGLPDKSYYLDDTETNLAIRAEYKKYLSFLLGKAGYPDPDTAATAVYQLERQIAEQHWDRALSRNRNLTYNKVNRAEMLAMAGDFPVTNFLSEIGLDKQDEFVVRQLKPTAEEIADNGLTAEQLAKLGDGVPGIFKVANEAPLANWQAYLAVRLLSGSASVLPSDIDEASFNFYGKTLRGQEKQRERWKRGVGAVEGALGEGVGKVYASRFFPAENKAAMDELVINLRKAMSANLDDIQWMSDTTKIEARKKLDKFTPKIGFTEKFETYDSLKVTQDSAYANSLAAGEWAFKDNLAKLGQPIDRTEWGILPQTVNAYYSPSLNEIVFPAAILQPPFFNLSADPAVNYGAIGGVIGHEIGHGFDDQGSKSDGDGVLRNWWTENDLNNFQGLTTALVDQYNALCPLDNGETCVNGRLTLGENIGDLGGLSMAYRAYKISLNGQEAPVIDGLTGDQRFFMAWAQVWRNKQREKALRQQLTTDPHSPADYRVNGIVRNFDEWYEAFNIGPEHKLYLPPEKRIRIW